ncbi:hypothetical protein ACOYR1_07625 [Thalassotalea piscium]
MNDFIHFIDSFTMLTKLVFIFISTAQTIFFSLFILSLFLIHNARAFEQPLQIPLSSLGDFHIEFTKIESSDYLEKQSVIGQVTYLTGENYSVLLPFDIQKISYTLHNGSQVNKGDIIAKVDGYDVHHFFDEYESAKAIFEASKHHYLTNKRYFNNKTIKSSEWLDITSSYFSAKLTLEHFHHQLAFLQVNDKDEVFFISPENGLLNLTDVTSSKSSGDLAFEIINEKSIRVKISLPLTTNNRLSHFLVSPSCSLSLGRQESLADKYHYTLWTVPDDGCHFTLGQRVTVTPIYHFNGYKIPKSAIFEFKDIDYLVLKNGDTLQLNPITIMRGDQAYAYVTSEKAIASLEVLTSSVSVIQGILLGLGAE